MAKNNYQGIEFIPAVGQFNAFQAQAPSLKSYDPSFEIQQLQQYGQLIEQSKQDWRDTETSLSQAELNIADVDKPWFQEQLDNARNEYMAAAATGDPYKAINVAKNAAVRIITSNDYKRRMEKNVDYNNNIESINQSNLSSLGKEVLLNKAKNNLKEGIDRYEKVSIPAEANWNAVIQTMEELAVPETYSYSNASGGGNSYQRRTEDKLRNVLDTIYDTNYNGLKDQLNFEYDKYQYQIDKLINQIEELEAKGITSGNEYDDLQTQLDLYQFKSDNGQIITDRKDFIEALIRKSKYPEYLAYNNKTNSESSVSNKGVIGSGIGGGILNTSSPNGGQYFKATQITLGHGNTSNLQGTINGLKSFIGLSFE